jgi:hypothetical protein
MYESSVNFQSNWSWCKTLAHHLDFVVYMSDMASSAFQCPINFIFEIACHKKELLKNIPPRNLYIFLHKFLFFEKNLGENINISQNNIISVEAVKVLQYCHLCFCT